MVELVFNTWSIGPQNPGLFYSDLPTGKSIEAIICILVSALLSEQSISMYVIIGVLQNMCVSHPHLRPFPNDLSPRLLSLRHTGGHTYLMALGLAAFFAQSVLLSDDCVAHLLLSGLDSISVSERLILSCKMHPSLPPSISSPFLLHLYP